jgi:hypothetical protein
MHVKKNELKIDICVNSAPQSCAISQLNHLQTRARNPCGKQKIGRARSDLSNKILLINCCSSGVNRSEFSFRFRRFIFIPPLLR